jgi:hypothetical protein
MGGIMKKRQPAGPQREDPPHPDEFQPDLPLVSAVVEQAVMPVVKKIGSQRDLAKKPCCILTVHSGATRQQVLICLHKSPKARAACEPPGEARAYFRNAFHSWRKLFYVRINYLPDSLLPGSGFTGPAFHGDIRIAEGPIVTVQCDTYTLRYCDVRWQRWH